MQNFIFLTISLIVSQLTFGQEVIFLHHSTGGNVFYKGNMAGWINTYNSANGTNVQITEREYPNSPWPWANYPYDYWKLWIDNSCNNTDEGIECLESITQQYDVIIFKHCFPGASIKSDNSTGQITSSEKTLPNYKLQYRALRDLFDQYPNNKFIAWTLAPLHRLATNTEDATRSNEFVNWVTTQWLTEENKQHPNIFVFDFYALAAELDAKPQEGQQYCLKYEYEGNHTDGNSHPNTLANQTIGPIFAQKIVDVALSNNSVSSTRTDHHHFAAIYPNEVC